MKDMSTAKKIIAGVATKVLESVKIKKSTAKGKAGAAESKPGNAAEKTKSSSVKVTPNKEMKSVAKSKKQAKEMPVVNNAPHGADMHLIPGHDVSGPVQIKDKNKVEKAFKHNEEIALHQEQQRAKNNLSTRQKRIFQHPRQS
jgi:hypothetical protein